MELFPPYNTTVWPNLNEEIACLAPNQALERTRTLGRAAKSIRDRPAKPAKRFGENERHNLEKKDQTLHGVETMVRHRKQM